MDTRFLRTAALAFVAPLFTLNGPVAAGTAPSFLIGTHNTLHGRGQFTRFASVIGWQEVDSPSARIKMRHQLGPAYRHYLPAAEPAQSIPISWRNDMFMLRSASCVKTHDGRARVSPNRYISIVRLQHRGTGRQFLFVNTHFISGAFDRKSSYTEWRRARWYEHLRKLNAVLWSLRRNHPGMPIFLVGDFNRGSYPSFSAQRVYPIRSGGATPIDKIYAGRPGYGGALQRLSRMGSDHSRWRAQVRIAG